VDQGGGRSFEEFFGASYGRLVGLLFAFVHDRAQAEDVVQDAFRRAVDHRRRNARQFRALLRLGPPPPPPPVGAEHVDLLRALRKLPMAQREVLVLHYVAELAVERIAAELGLPAGTVKSRLARGRAALGHHLQPGVGAPNEESTNA
jgi:RNA polymerase sigma-70 factor (ECF subfamily)